MSNISNRHNVNPFVAGKSQPLTGQRLAKVGYKTTKKQAAKFPSVCVSVPKLEDAQIIPELERMIPYVRTMLENAQDGIIRSLYESSNGNLSSVADSELDVSACIAFMDAESNGGRLTKEFLASWFDANIADNLTVAVAEKLGTENVEDARIVKTVKAYKDMITALSGGATFYQPEQVKSLQKAISLSSEDDDTAHKLTKRLDSMINREKIEDLLEF